MEGDRLNRLLLRFATAARAHNRALEAMDEERTNSHAQVLAGLYRSIASSGEQSRLALLALVDDRDPVVAGMAAVYSLHCDNRRCLAVLERITREPGLLGMRAKAAVERWKSGEWPAPDCEMQ